MYEFSRLCSRMGPYWTVGELLQKSGVVAGVAQVVRGRHFALMSASYSASARCCASLASSSYACALCWSAGSGCGASIVRTLNTTVP